MYARYTAASQFSARQTSCGSFIFNWRVVCGPRCRRAIFTRKLHVLSVSIQAPDGSRLWPTGRSTYITFDRDCARRPPWRQRTNHWRHRLLLSRPPVTGCRSIGGGMVIRLHSDSAWSARIKFGSLRSLSNSDERHFRLVEFILRRPAQTAFPCYEVIVITLFAQ